MKRVLPVFLTLVCLFLFANPVFAQTPEPNSDDVETEDDAAVGRVIRVSFVEGDVSFQRAGTSEWAAAIENLPLFAGDQIYAGKDARVELQIGRGSYIRLSENTALTVTELRDDAVQFEMPAGMAFIRVEQLAAAFKRFEVDTPNAALLLEQDGLYRVNVRGDNDSEVIVRHGAAEVSTEDGSFKVREGRRLLIDTSANGRLEVAYDTTQDDWDLWSTTRDATINSQYINNSPDDVTQYETTYSDFYGVSDLSSYGSWGNDPTYGNCWRPYGVATGWAPYRQGQWIWTRAGWTWVSSEPWGWAPYHYGRWVYTSRWGWAWVPGYGRSTGRYDNHSWRAYYRWRPALVGFFDAPSPRGHYVGWYPLAPGQRWHRPDGQRFGGDHSRLQYPTGRDNWRGPGRSTFGVSPRDGRGVTLLPVEGFNRSDRTKLRPVTPDQDLSNWIKRGARPGLPEIKPAPVAIAPVTKDERRYRIAIPSNEIIHRPVVTRNRPTDAEATVNPPRERRLITPRTPVMSNDEPARREKRQRGDDQRMQPPAVARPAEGQNNNPSYQKPNRQSEEVKPHIMPAERVEGDNSRSERKAKRKADESAQPASNRSDDNRPGNDASGERHKRPTYTPPPQDPAAGNNDAGGRERKQRDEEQIRQRDEERARQREAERQRQAEEDRARQQQEEMNRQRNEERQRQREAERQQRQNEDHARQQQEERQRQQEADRARQQQEERQRRNDEERNRQRNEERVRDQAPKEKPPAQQQEQRPSKEERRAEREQRKKP
jgi:hypothetical protein